MRAVRERLFSNCCVMHVCHLTKYFAPAAGGIETHVQVLARAQAAAGHRVTVVCVEHRPYSQTQKTADMPEDGITVIRVPRRFTLAKWDYCPGLGRLIGKMESQAPAVDLFHLHTPNPTMTLALSLQNLSKPLVITHHSDVVKQRVLGRALSVLDSRLLRRAKCILTTSPGYAQGSRQLASFLNKVEPVPLGIDLDQFLRPTTATLASEAHIRSNFPGPIWLSVGRLVYYKGLETAIQALTKLPGRLLIVGEGPLQERWAALARRCGVADRVVWLGKVNADYLAGLYRAATALLFPSNARSEAFGLVQVEAMASACPVINTAIPNSGVSWVSLHGETGLTVGVGDADGIVAAATRLIDEPELRERLAANARKRAIELFDYRETTRRNLEIYSRYVRERERCTDS